MGIRWDPASRTGGTPPMGAKSENGGSSEGEQIDIFMIYRAANKRNKFDAIF